MTEDAAAPRSGRGRAPGDITCQELVELVTDYLEGRLSEPERRRFETHLDDCPYCATYVEQMRETIAAVGRLPVEAVPPEAEEALLRAFRGWKRG